MDQLTSTQPYLIDAFYRWITDNQLTPYLLIKNDVPGVELPQSLLQEERTVLNIAPAAIRDFDLNQEWLRFTTCFDGIPEPIALPIPSILAIYARENGKGAFFEEDSFPEPLNTPPPPVEPPPEPERPKKKRPKLSVVK